MTEKLDRKVMKIYGENAAARDIIAYGSDIAGDIVQTKDPDEIQNSAYVNGVRDAIIGQNSTTLQNRQTLDYLFSRQLKYLYQHGIPEWGADETYYKSSVVKGSDGNLYGSITDNNEGHDPVTDTSHTYWRNFPTYQELDAKVNKAGDTMTGQLVMAKGSDGIRFDAPDTPAGWVGGDQDLTNDQKEILYNFFYPTDQNTIEWISQHPLKAGERYRLYSGTKTDTGHPTIIYDGIGFIDSNNLYCTYGGGLSTSPTEQWWSNPGDYGITITLNRVVTKNSAPTSYQEASTNNFYYLKPGSGGLVEGDGTNEYKILVDTPTIDYVVESYSDDDGNWYRKYNSGWVEQGGIVPAQGTATTVTITLLKAMKNTKFTVLTNPISTNTSATSNNYVNVFNITTTSFNLQVWNYAEKRWCVFGQGAN